MIKFFDHLPGGRGGACIFNSKPLTSLGGVLYAMCVEYTEFVDVVVFFIIQRFSSAQCGDLTRAVHLNCWVQLENF